VVILLDSINHPDVLQQLFGRQRDDLWQLPFTWVVTGNRSDRTRYLNPLPTPSSMQSSRSATWMRSKAADLLRRQAQHAGSGDPGAEILLSLAAALAQRVKPLTPRNLLAAARDVRVPPSSPNAVPRLTVRTLDSSRPHRTGVAQSVRFPCP
jgi:hypothetical protein